MIRTRHDTIQIVIPYVACSWSGTAFSSAPRPGANATIDGQLYLIPADPAGTEGFMSWDVRRLMSCRARVRAWGVDLACVAARASACSWCCAVRWGVARCAWLWSICCVAGVTTAFASRAFHVLCRACVE